MYTLELIVLLLSSLFGRSPACPTYLASELQRVPTYGYYYDLSQVQRYGNIKQVTTNATIVCANVTSLLDVDHVYVEKQYEQFLKIIDSNISTLSAGSFDKFRTIAKLFLNHTHIATIMPEAFRSLTNLTELYLNNNELTEVMKGIFHSLTSLEKLDISSNKIHTIEKFALYGLSSLQQLYFSNNSLTSVQDNMIDGLTRLQVLDLSGNTLKEFRMLLPNTTLKLLNLSSNNLETMDFSIKTSGLDLSKNAISSLGNVSNIHAAFLKLNYNRIRYINGTFQNVTRLFLGNNQISDLNNSFFASPQNVEVLDVSFNVISTLKKKVFEHFGNLTELYLSHNRLITIDRGLFKDLIKLKLLNISYNQISEFQYGTFDRLSQLRMLDVSHNKLTQLYESTLHSLSRLALLYFANNNISSLDVQYLYTHLKSLNLVCIENNSWRCKELSSIYHDLKMRRIEVLEGHNYEEENIYGIACSSEDDVPSEPPETKHMEEFSERLVEFLEEQQNSSKLDKFFNEDFQKSRFFQFFNSANLSYFTKNLDESNVVVERSCLPQKADVVGLIHLILLTGIVFLLLASLYLRIGKRKYKVIRKDSELSEYLT